MEENSEINDEGSILYKLQTQTTWMVGLVVLVVLLLFLTLWLFNIAPFAKKKEGVSVYKTFISNVFKFRNLSILDYIVKVVYAALVIVAIYYIVGYVRSTEPVVPEDQAKNSGNSTER